MKKIILLLIFLSALIFACNTPSQTPHRVGEYTEASERLAYYSAQLTMCIEVVVDPRNLSSAKAYSLEECNKMVNAMKAANSYERYRAFLKQNADMLTQTANTPTPAGPQG